MITKRQMGLAAPTAARTGRLDEWYAALILAMGRHNITTPARQQFFLANIMEETGELQAKVENLNYSADRLRQIFPSIFDGQANADQTVAGGQEAIGNAIYGDQFRSGGYKLGNVDPGDGYKYRGRGPMQLTGRGNYEQFFRAAGLPIDSNPDLLLAPQMGAESAAHFWDVAGCNACADRGDFEAAVRKVNGGTINMATRQMYLARFVDAMNHPDPPVPGPQTFKENINPPAPEPLPPPVTAEDLKPKPELEPVPPPPPVPPPGFSVQPSGNVIIDDVGQSGIVKKANAGQVVSVGLGTAGAGLGVASQAKGLLGGMDNTAMICLTVIVIVLSVLAFFYFRGSKNDRIDLNKRGIA